MTDLATDVLVVGGGPAAAWAALAAAQAGARVVLADKGYCGTSGATAAGGTGVWYVPPDPATREAAGPGTRGGVRPSGRSCRGCGPRRSAPRPSPPRRAAARVPR
ncbi:FAD-dependent oxidoreductase [Streptomyces erythrochromogenes]|uniref:FAD-dependent oxidoreductase n=1 Tax=Streptomyces erythrochromogenes TaxID=285574 RepID=UPI0033FF94FB